MIIIKSTSIPHQCDDFDIESMLIRYQFDNLTMFRHHSIIISNWVLRYDCQKINCLLKYIFILYKNMLGKNTNYLVNQRFLDFSISLFTYRIIRKNIIVYKEII